MDMASQGCQVMEQQRILPGPLQEMQTLLSRWPENIYYTEHSIWLLQYWICDISVDPDQIVF
jgi:hypothetical protein